METALAEEKTNFIAHAGTIEATCSASLLGERLFSDSADRVRLLRFGQVVRRHHHHHQHHRSNRKNNTLQTSGRSCALQTPIAKPST